MFYVTARAEGGLRSRLLDLGLVTTGLLSLRVLLIVTLLLTDLD